MSVYIKFQIALLTTWYHIIFFKNVLTAERTLTTKNIQYSDRNAFSARFYNKDFYDVPQQYYFYKLICEGCLESGCFEVKV